MRFYVILLGTWVCTLQIVHAAEWGMDAGINQKFSYNDNVRMLEDKKGSFIYQFIPVLNAHYATQRSRIEASASYGVQVYETIPELNRGVQNYSLMTSHQTERVLYSLSTKYGKEPARNSADTDSGNFATNADRTSWSVQPGLVYRLTPRDSLSLQGSYGQTSYSKSEQDDKDEFGDNRSIIFDLGWKRRWTERYSGAVSVMYYRHESEPTLLSIVSDSYGINFSHNYFFSKKWQLLIDLGYRYTDTVNTGLNMVRESGSHGFLTDSSLTYIGEDLVTSLSVQQSLIPDGEGQLNQQSGVSLAIDYQITDRLSTALETSYLYNKPIGGEREGSDDDRQNITFTPSVSYQLSPDWIISGSYSFHQQVEKSRNYVSDSNTYMVTLGYNWQGLKLSR